MHWNGWVLATYCLSPKLMGEEKEGEKKRMSKNRSCTVSFGWCKNRNFHNSSTKNRKKKKMNIEGKVLLFVLSKNLIFFCVKFYSLSNKEARHLGSMKLTLTILFCWLRKGKVEPQLRSDLCCSTPCGCFQSPPWASQLQPVDLLHLFPIF